MATAAPRRASSNAVAAPTPVDDPVTMKTGSSAMRLRFRLVGERVAGRALLDDVAEAQFDREEELRMRDDVEAVLAHRLEGLLRHLRGGQLARRDRLVRLLAREDLRLRRWRAVDQIGGPVAVGVPDPRRHVGGADDGDADARSRDAKVVMERLAERHHGMLAYVVDAHQRSRDEPRG